MSTSAEGEQGPAHTLFVIPCAARKLSHPAVARRLYASHNFAHTLRAAETAAAADADHFGHRTTVVVLSAKHGLVGLDQHIAPYDVTWGDDDAITAEALADQFSTTFAAVARVAAMLPRGYLAQLRKALELVNASDRPGPHLLDVYDGAPGIGYQRQIAAALIRKPRTGFLAPEGFS